MVPGGPAGSGRVALAVLPCASRRSQVAAVRLKTNWPCGSGEAADGGFCVVRTASWPVAAGGIFSARTCLRRKTETHPRRTCVRERTKAGVPGRKPECTRGACAPQEDEEAPAAFFVVRTAPWPVAAGGILSVRMRRGCRKKRGHPRDAWGHVNTRGRGRSTHTGTPRIPGRRDCWAKRHDKERCPRRTRRSHAVRYGTGALVPALGEIGDGRASVLTGALGSPSAQVPSRLPTRRGRSKELWLMPASNSWA